MDNQDIEKYKREVEQNQMREQGLLLNQGSLFFDQYFLLRSALKKNALLDDIRKGIQKMLNLIIDLFLYYFFYVP